MSSPAGVFTVPLGVVEVCQAGTSFTQPQSNLTVPPMFGSATFSMPFSWSSFASSTMATHWAPVRLAMSTTSPQWSAWPCVRKMCVGSTSSGPTAATGLPLRNGSIRMRVSPSLSSKHAWPRKRMSIGLSSGVSVVVQLARELPAHGHAHQHPDPRLLGEEGADRDDPLLGVGRGGRLQQLALVRLAEPAAGVQSLAEDALELRRHAPDAGLGR